MSQSTSSAVPRLLDRYSIVLQAVDQDLLGATSGLASALNRFEATCREYPVHVSHVSGLVGQHAHSCQGVDHRVGMIAQGFWLADQASMAASGVWVATTATLSSDRTRRAVEWLKSAKEIGYDGLWDLSVKNIRSLRGYAAGVRFIPSTGWRDYIKQRLLTGHYRDVFKVTGSNEALKSIGHNPAVRRFGEKYLTRQLVIKPGPLSSHAKSILRHVPQKSIYEGLKSIPAHLKDAFGIGHGTKGFFKSPAGLAAVTTVAFNVYEFGFGENRETGLRSRQFVTATAADLVASGGIIAVSTAVGSVVPVAGTAVGFVVGVGLSWAYENYGKDSWRNAIDGAAVKLTESATEATKVAQRQVLRSQRDLVRAAYAVEDIATAVVTTTLHAAAARFGQFTTSWAFQT